MTSAKFSIESLVPHAGRMVLIDALLDHDSTKLRCRANTGPLEDHPLARQGYLPATALAEYAAQAMAVHGSLLADGDEPARQGQLVALSALDLHCAALDRAAELLIEVERIGGSGSGEVYEFQVAANNELLARGQATIMFPDAGAAA